MADAGFELTSQGADLMVQSSDGIHIMAVPAGVEPVTFRAVLAATYSAYLSYGRRPSLAEAHEFWSRIGEETYAIVWATDEFEDAMRVRGVHWEGDFGLSYEQSLTIDKLSNALDKRSDESKLRELGVSAIQYAAWRKNPLFMRILEQRATSNVKEHIPAILNRLVGKAEQGNIAAIDRVLTLDGRYDPQNREATNLREFLNAFMRIVQTRVEDPEVRQQIAADLMAAGAEQAMIEASKNTSI